MNDPFDLAVAAEEFNAVTPQTAPDPAYLTALNAEQRAAVEAIDGPVLVLAGAGTGKTRVLTTRLAHILFQGKAFPGEILAVTFTNKAAREMVERVSSLIGRPAEGLWLGTFHAMAARILRRHAELVGLKSDFTILDSDDQGTRRADEPGVGEHGDAVLARVVRSSPAKDVVGLDTRPRARQARIDDLKRGIEILLRHLESHGLSS